MIRVSSVFALGILSLVSFASSESDCPWSREAPETSPLNSACLCALNPKNEYSIQCSAVLFPLLMSALHGRAKDIQLNLLYVNNSNINVINDRTFYGLTIKHLQISFSGISNISDNAFEGVEDHLQHLYLQDNRLQEIPINAISILKNMNLLDLTGNGLTHVPDRAFDGLHINTLKLSRNPLAISPNAFTGIEDSLKNLNLKECNLLEVPLAIRKLKSLAFLDLAQNEIRTLKPGVLEPLDSLTALNLERNLLQDLDAETFVGVSDTLSSLSLLNNLLTKFPVEALNSLPQLRVLDVGFNLITRMPVNAFHGIKFLTLLAVDGNPIPTIPEASFQHLNGTLRGLSVGGRYLVCDCKMAWITEWIRDSDLRVTSRDRDPQFCGQPGLLRDQSFYQLTPQDFICENEVDRNVVAMKQPPIRVAEEDEPLPENPQMVDEPLSGPIDLNDEESEPTHEGVVEVLEDDLIDEPLEFEAEKVEPIPSTQPPQIQRQPPTPRPSITRPSLASRDPPRQPPNKTTKPVEFVSTYKPPLVRTSTTTSPPRQPTIGEGSVELQEESNDIAGDRSYSNPTYDDNNDSFETKKETVKSPSKSKRPPLITRSDRPTNHAEEYYANNDKSFGQEVIVQNAFWDSNAINVQWDSEVSNILGFRVVYRLFGDSYFKMGQPLSPSAREFKIKNVPANEYFVACVVSLEDMDIKLESVPFGQCREIRTGDSPASLSTHMDKIIIAASASICGTVIIAVVIFICCYRGGKKKESEKQGIPAVLSHTSPPLASLGALGSGKTDWDTISMYSQRSIPRARMYHVDKDDTRSHISQMSSKSRPRSLADGQSQRSFSGLSGVHPATQFLSPLTLSRPDLRLSRQSLANSQFGANYPHFANTGGMVSRATSQRSERRRSRSKSRERAGSRLSHAGSSHSLTGYDTDGWTDHDMDIYMARNPTRGGLVQL